MADDETLPQATTRWMAENQGDSWRERVTRLLAGVARGGGDVGDVGAQLIAAAGEGTGNILESVHALSSDHAAAVRNWRADVNRRINAGQQGFEEAPGA